MKHSTRSPILHPRQEHQDQAAALAVFAFILGVIVGMNL